jgi:hypothetical protein
MTCWSFPMLAAYVIGVITKRNIFLTKEVKKALVNKIAASEE